MENYELRLSDLKPLGYGLAEYAKRNSMTGNLHKNRIIAIRALPLSVYHMATVLLTAGAIVKGLEALIK